ncbi:MAG: serine hydrolase [Cyanobacteria bacterium P01_D01_bin.105]
MRLSNRWLDRALSSCFVVGLCLTLLCAGVTLWPLPTAAQMLIAQGQAQAPAQSEIPKPVPPTDVLSRLFTKPELQRVWFADSFLSQISLAEVSQIIQGIGASIGTYQSIEDVDNGFVLTFERGTVPAHLALNAQGQITGLLFETPKIAAVPLDEAIALFEALPGKVHVLATKNGEDIAAVNAEQPLAVGSTFKLWVLKALQQQIADGQHRWDEVVTLKEEWKSLPSGFLQTWPEGAQLTLESLAALMISQSDNTATDHVLNIVGREAIEALLPENGDNRNDTRNKPFLTTREFFVLKDPANIRVLQRWRRSQEKRTLLSPLAALPLPPITIFNNGPVAIDVEWFFTARELCDAMSAVAELPLMSINPGLLDAADWQKVSFKGGSEPGVENFTTYLINNQGDTICVTATWNNDAGIDELQFSTLYRSLIESVAVPATPS